MNQNLSKNDASARRWLDHSPLTVLRREMDDLVENFFGGRTGLPLSVTDTVPRLDVVETEDAIEVTTDLPGFKPEEVHIDVNDGHLTLSGQRSSEQKSSEPNGKKYHRIERRSGSFSRSVWLPCAIDEERIEAELKEGVLTVRLPKAKASQRKKIAVKGVSTS